MINALLLALLSLPAAAFDFQKPFELVWHSRGASMTELSAHSGEVTVLKTFPDGKRLLTLADGAARVWDFAARRELLLLRPEGGISACDLSADGRVIATAEGRVLRLRAAEDGAELKAFDAREALKGLETWESINALKLGADGRRVVAVAGRDDWSKAVAVDLGEGRVLGAADLAVDGKEKPSCVAVSADLRRAAAIYDRKGRLYDLESGRLLSSWSELKRGDVSTCWAEFSPDGGSLIVGRPDAAALRSLPEGKEKARLKVELRKHSDITDVFFSPDGARAMVGSLDGLWEFDAEGGQLLSRSEHYDRGQVLSPDGKVAYSRKNTISEAGGEKKVIPGWVFAHDTATGKQVGRPLPGADTAEVKMARRPDGTSLSGYGIDAASLAVFNKAFKECSSGFTSGFEKMAACLKTMRAQAAAAEPVPPAPAELAQGRYESSAVFQARVAAAKAEYEAKVAEREKRISSIGMPPSAMPATFLLIFGVPKVYKVAYDPDTRIFSFNVVGDSLYGVGIAMRMALKEQIPNEAAEEFEKKLSAAELLVTLRVADNNFSIERVSFWIGDTYSGRSYEAVPADEAEARELARVRIAEVKPAEDSEPDVSFGYEQSRELAAKKKELEDARKRHATAAQIAALEAQLKGLSPAEAEIDSDADAPVAARPEDPAAYAVVVGVESYQMTDLPKARFAERDARSVARRLEALGVPPRNMKVLIGSGATKAKLASVLQDWLPQRAKEGAKVYFYFSGHGAPDAASGDSYLVPWDGDPSLLKATGYRLSALYADLAKLPAAKRVALLDACFSGAGGRSLLAKGARPLVSVTEGDSGTVTVLAAASSSQITATLESQGHGLFTYHLLKSLGAGGRSASAVYAELKPKVEDDASRQSREQTPAFRGPDAQIP